MSHHDNRITLRGVLYAPLLVAIVVIPAGLLGAVVLGIAGLFD